jgi:U3 small nucleolar RNA-associated protein 14
VERPARGQAEVFAEQQLEAGDRHRQQQVERAALALADDGVEAEHQRDQRNQVDHQADQAGDGELDRAKPDRALLRAAESRR